MNSTTTTPPSLNYTAVSSLNTTLSWQELEVTGKFCLVAGGVYGVAGCVVVAAAFS